VKCTLIALNIWRYLFALFSINVFLKNKQRECLKLPESDIKENSQLLECQRKKRRKLQSELAGLQLRKTELVGDCVSEHLDQAESTLDPSKVVLMH
jgi:hypothetical protein